MPVVQIDATEGILRLGVSGPLVGSMVMPFDIGGAGIITNEQPFDIESPYVGVTNVQVFDISGNIRVVSEQPFDLGEVTYTTNVQPFDIIAYTTNPVPGTPQPQPQIATSTVTTSDIVIGTSTLTVSSTSGITAGTTIFLLAEPMVAVLVTGVSGLTLTVAQAFGSGYPTGISIGVPYINATLAAPASAGDTTIEVTDATGITIGTVLSLTNLVGETEHRVVTGISGTTITLAVPLGNDYPIGSGVAPSTPFLTGMFVFDKAGNALGNIQDFTVNSSRSYSIGEPGSLGFYIPRNSPDIALVKGDRLVAMTNDVGLPLWVGSIGTQEWADGTVNVHCEDAFSLLAGVPIDIDMEVLDDTPAAAVYGAVIDLVNERRGLDGEIQWEKDLQGSKPFLGDFSFAGDPDDAMRTIADRSGTEYAWRGSIEGSKLVVTLVVRDSFSAGTGVALTDGEGGNVVVAPTYQVDPTTIINGLRLTGDTTNIKNYVDDWAEWAVHDVEPVVEMYSDTGDYRRRIDLDVSVDFSLSKRTQHSLARKTSEEVWSLYERYLYAVHDIQGRPNHPGYVYEGPPEDIEPQLTKDVWRTHLELALLRDTRPISLVMKSSYAWLGVSYNGTFSAKTVHIWPFGSTYTPKIADISVRPGSHTIWEESGGVTRPYTTYTNATTETWVVSLNTITAKTSSGTRLTLRGIRSPTALRGRYLNTSDAAYYNFDPHDAIENVDDEGSQIGRVWGVEKGAIRQWDPRRDGIGAQLARETVYDGRLTTRPRWHIVPYSTGEEAETQLAEGVFVVNVTGSAVIPNLSDEIYVESGQSFPLDNLPFDILVGDPLVGDQEIMRVWKTFGNRWTVWRGQSISAVTLTANVGAGATVLPVTSTAGFVTSMSVIIGDETRTVEEVGTSTLTVSTPTSNAHLTGTVVTTSGYIYSHAQGSMVRLLYGVPFDGFQYPYDWPEGEEYARNLLNRLSLPSRLISVKVANENDDWRTFQYGSLHAVDIQTEGPSGGVTGTGRCIGFSPDEDDGTMEVVMEMLP